MAVTTITVQGKVVGPNGAGVDGGRIIIRLAGSYTTDDSGTEQVVGGAFEEPIAADGSVNFSIIPNDVLSPAGSRYEAEFISKDGQRWTRTWGSIASSPSTQDIGDL